MKRSSGFRRKGPKEPPIKELVAAERLVNGWLRILGYDAAHLAVFEAWDRLLGAEADRARAVGLKNGHLMVETDTSARLHDLTLRKPSLLGKLRGHFGPSCLVSDIILKLAPTPTGGQATRNQPKFPPHA